MNNSQKILLSNMINIYILLVFTYFLTYFAVYILRNPDLDAYNALYLYSDKAYSTLEPTFFLISDLSKKISNIILGTSSVFLLYYLYIVLILYSSFMAFRKAISNFAIMMLAFIIWFFSYGLMHGLIQIRFGLANSIFIYIFFSKLFEKSLSFKNYVFSILGSFTHYSTIFAFFIINFLGFNNTKLNSSYILHIGFTILLVLFKIGSIFNFLPKVLMARLSGYLNVNADLDKITITTSVISIMCYMVLMLAPKLNNEKYNSIRYYGALSFLPYFIVPEYEILVRLGIPFQYLLIPYLFLTFRYKQAIPTTILLIGFFSYKIYSSITALIGYL